MFSVIYLFFLFSDPGKQIPYISHSDLHFTLRFAFQTPERKHLACVQRAEPELQLIQSD